MNEYPAPFNLLIVDDHQLITEGLSYLLKSEKFIKEIFTAKNGQEAINIALQFPVECVIMDINMPVLNGLEATKQLKKAHPGIKIIVVSMQCDASIINRMLKAGADAFINKDTGKHELILAMQKVMHGDKYISPEISHILFTHIGDMQSQVPESEKHLTEREIEILRHIADGLTNQEIAVRLFLSTVTVDTHRKNMISKLQLKNTASLVKYAADHKLL